MLMVRNKVIIIGPEDGIMCIGVVEEGFDLLIKVNKSNKSNKNNNNKF